MSLVLLLCCLAVTVSCTVKEDRTVCPCIITADLSSLDVQGMRADGCATLRWSLSSGEGLREGTFFLADLPDSFEIPSPRENVRLTLFAGAEEALTDEGEVLIPEGSESPPIWAYSAVVDAVAAEETLVKVQMHKKFAVLEMRLVGLDDFFSGCSVVVEGRFAGLSDTLTPKEGPFRVVSHFSSGGSCSMRLPVQGDSSLRLSLYRDGVLERSFALGEYIGRSRFDWSATDLGDIFLEIELLRSAAKIKINQWEDILFFSIVV